MYIFHLMQIVNAVSGNRLSQPVYSIVVEFLPLASQ